MAETFAKGVAASVDSSTYFGEERRLSTRWNMLGAVLANRGRYED